MMPACANESAALLKLAPEGMTTRTGAPYGSPAQPLSVRTPTAATASRRQRGRWVRKRSGRESQCMLQQDGGGQRVHVALTATRRAAHLAHGAQGGRRREPLIYQTSGEPRSLLQLGRDATDLSA